jgi:hypothetical protein
VLRDVLRRLGIVDRLDDEPAAEVAATPSPAAVAVAPYMVDAHTRTYWSVGADSPQTLVEAGAGGDLPRVGAVVAAMVARTDAGAPRPRRPVTDPAFSEALFVELIRERRFDRAFALLTPDCQQSWGSEERFAAEQRAGEGTSLLGVDVRSVRLLDEWTDDRHGVSYQDVAELEVAYAVRARERTVMLPRTVHLVAVEGRWRSIAYPGT